MRYLIWVLVLSALGQDASLPDLLRRLEDDRAEVREKAEKALAGLGEAALPALREVAESTQASGELKLRAAQVIREIELAQKTAKVYTEPAPVTLTAQGLALRELLAEITRQSGVVIDASAVDQTAPVTLEARQAPLFEVLDRLCRDQAERNWESRDDGSIRLTRERHPPVPAVYQGPFRVRVGSLSTQRTNDWKARTVALTAVLQADWDRRLRPSKFVDLEVERAKDDLGTALEVAPFDGNLNWRGGPGAALRVGVGVVILGDAAESSRTFVLKGIAPAARAVELEGVARYTFPLDQREIRFDAPGATETRELGDTTIRLSHTATPEVWTLSFHKSVTANAPGWARSIGQRFDPESFIVVDQDGAETAATMRPQGRGRMMQEAAGEIGVWYQAFVQRTPGKAPKQVRFRFVDQTLVKSVPFRFADLPLP